MWCHERGRWSSWRRALVAPGPSAGAYGLDRASAWAWSSPSKGQGIHIAPCDTASQRAALLLLAVVTAGCSERTSSPPPDRRPWRCYTLQFAEWQPVIPQERIAFLPRGVELDAVLIAPTAPQRGLRINAL